MVREIEFRGKGIYAVYVNKETGKEQLQWCYGTLHYIYEKDCKHHRTDKAIINSRFGGNEVLLSTVGQFTGLKDKNGTKIYEGDIVRYYRVLGCNTMDFSDDACWKIVEYTDYVIFDNGRFVLNDGSFDLAVLCTDRRRDETLSENYGNVVNRNEYPEVRTLKDVMFAEVIGNIYDNPELIIDGQEHVCPEYIAFLKKMNETERLKEKYGFASYEDVYQEYCRSCELYNMVVPSFEEWIPKEEYRREILCRTDEKYKDYKFVSYKDYKKD